MNLLRKGMEMDHIRLMVRHELLVLIRNRTVLFSNIFGLGLIFTLLLGGIVKRGGPELTALFLILIFAVAAGTPLSLAVHAFVGEKERHTLEPLLLTPVRMRSMVVGKLAVPCLVSLVELALVWFGGVVGVLTLGTPEQYGFVVNATTAYAAGVLAPLFTVLFSLVAIIISGRATDTQAATNLNLVVASPIALLLFAVWFGLIGIDRRALTFGTFVLLVASLFVFRVALAALHSEVLLRRRG